MTAPNVQTTNLTKFFGDGNPDGELFGPKVITTLTPGNATVTANQLVNGIATMLQTANGTITTDTYANIANQVGTNRIPLNGYFEFTLICANSAANTALTLAGGTGVTITGNATVPLLTSATYDFVFNSNGTITAYRV